MGKAKPEICIRHAIPNMTTTKIIYFTILSLPRVVRLTEYLGEIQEYQEKYQATKAYRVSLERLRFQIVFIELHHSPPRIFYYS